MILPSHLISRSVVRSFVAALLLVSLAAAPAAAQRSEILTTVSHDQMRSILRAVGMNFTESTASGRSEFKIQMEGLTVTLANRINSFELYVRTGHRPPLDKVNEWNRSYNYSRAYLSTDGAVTFLADLNLAGGITRGGIEEYLRTYQIYLRMFIEFLNKAGGSTPTPTPAPTPAPPVYTPPPAPTYNRPYGSTSRFPTPYGNFVIWVNPTKWRNVQTEGAGNLQFNHTNGEAFARIISERISVPTNSLKEIALQNAKKADPNAFVSFEERRTVNGRQVVCLQIDFTVSNIPSRYYGYYYGGSSGTIQVVTYTFQSAFDRNRADFTDFLNGLEINDTELTGGGGGSTPPIGGGGTSGRGEIRFNNDRMWVNYERSKWKQETSTESGRYLFQHSTGNAYALIIAENLTMSLDSMPQIALDNAKQEDPNARITYREKRFVNGVEVWVLKLDATVRQIPITYMGYYYSGKQGTVQVLTYTGKNLFAEMEAEMLAFLNGFRVSP
ncbi:MAG TPA: YbjN domain-containing protein [Candidatus Nitrosotenuis sp.]|nr:YbjN domain-containing protein [Candidatus Nitrosotenuis sp.]